MRRRAAACALVLLLGCLAVPTDAGAPVKLQGRVHDLRGRAVAGYTLAFDPPALTVTEGPDGSFIALLDSAAPVTVTAAHRGYGALPALSVDPAVSGTLDLALPPRANLALNGDFESATLPPWTATGRLPVAVSAFYPHTGRFAALLGARAGVAGLDTERGALSQTIQLPPAITRPHLSFYASSVSLPLTQLRATVDDAGERRILPLKRSNDGSWIHFWADLTQWGGLNVILTIEVWEAEGPGSGQVALDDVSVGEWYTPGITAVSPALLPANRALTFTVTGDNFEDGVTATLDGGRVSLVRRSPWLLEVQTSAGLAPGLHNLWVENPGGEAAITTIAVGRPLLLPWLPR